MSQKLKKILLVIQTFYIFAHSSSSSVINYTKLMKKEASFNTFSTKLIWSPDEKRTTPTTITQLTSSERPKIFLNDIRLDYDQNKFYILGFLCLFLLTPLGILIWLFKNYDHNCFLRFFCKFCCTKIFSAFKNRQKPAKSQQNDTNLIKNESLMSGECGCFLKIKQNKADVSSKYITKIKQDNNAHDFIVNNTNLDRMLLTKRQISLASSDFESRKSMINYTIRKVMSVCMFLAFKTDKNDIKTRQNFDTEGSSTFYYFDSIEDLDEYDEYTRNSSLIDLTKKLKRLEGSSYKRKYHQIFIV
jgi:hypothetical protein